MTIDLPEDTVELAKSLATPEKDAAAVINEGLAMVALKRKEVAAVMEGIADADAGRTQPLTAFDAEMRQELGLPPRV